MAVCRLVLVVRFLRLKALDKWDAGRGQGSAEVVFKVEHSGGVFGLVLCASQAAVGAKETGVLVYLGADFLQLVLS